MFRFKRFTVEQDQSAFKVGTDSILLGSWANPEGSQSILDIGTGTGILALMMAQKTEVQKSHIHAIELDLLSTQQALLNFRNSPWNERMTVISSSVQDFAQNTNQQFDCIICNPPFYTSQFLNHDERKALARNTRSLELKDLAEMSSRLLTDNGALFLILPFPESESFELAARSCGLTLAHRTRVFSKPSKKPEIRQLMKWIKSTDLQSNTQSTLEDEITLEADVHHVPTEVFKAMTREFYLNF